MLNIKDISRKVAEDEDIAIVVAERIVENVFDIIKSGVDKQIDVRISKFGTFKSKDTKARVARNPRTGEEVKVKASRRVGFSPARDFKELMKK